MGNRFFGGTKGTDENGGAADVGTGFLSDVGSGNAGGNDGASPAPETPRRRGERPRRGEAPAENAALEKAPARVDVPPVEIPSVPAPAKVEEGGKKKRRSSSKSSDLTELTTNFTALIQAGYGMAAQMLNSPVFAVSTEEAESIAAPMARIFDRLNMSSTMNKYGDYAMLFTAVAAVTIPRVLVSRETMPKKEVKKHDPNSVKSAGNGGQSGGDLQAAHAPAFVPDSRAAFDVSF